ncbi:MAG TPA: DoxX family protein [Burkholderiales bacterium]
MNPAGQSNMMLLGRILMAVAGTAGYFAKLGFPMPGVMVWVSIVIEIGGAVLLILGWQTRRIAWLLILFVVIATAMAHRFWEVDAAQYGAQLNYFLKNLAVVGGLLYVAAFGAGALSVDGRARTS